MRSGVVALAVLAVGCGARSELLVVLTTDLTVPAEANGLALTVTYPDRPGELAFDREYVLPRDATLPASIDLASTADPPPTVALSARLSLDGKQVVERDAVVALEAGRARLLRLPLERACAPVQCSKDQTCAAGVCRPSLVQPGELGDVPADPLGDLSTGATDLGAGDLAASDLAGACPEQTAPPSFGPSCTTYTFDGGLPPGLATLDPNVDQARIDYACPGMMHIHVPAGSDHAFDANDDRAFRLVEMGSTATTDDSVTAVFHGQLAGGDTAGPAAFDANKQYIYFYLDAVDHERVGHWAYQGASWQDLNSLLAPSHTVYLLSLQLSRVTMAGANLRGIDFAGAADDQTNVPIAYPHRRGFFVSTCCNAQSPAADVWLEYLVLCGQ